MKKGVTAPRGFLASGINCGIKKNNKKDLAIIFSEVPAVVSGVTTQNKCPAAPVIYSRRVLKNKIAQAVIVNSGNANAFTGEKGLDDADKIALKASQVLDIKKSRILVASTGIIGKRLPLDKIKKGIILASMNLSRKGIDAASAIMTTDRWVKIEEERIKIQNRTVTVGGIAKGGGMIAPNMATMLAFLTTDANITNKLLSRTIKETVNKTFNLITVDGDTSTNDMVVILANGLSGIKKIKNNTKEYTLFKNAVEKICFKLAKEIVKDGEGTKKVIKLNVKGAKSLNDAKAAARAILNSVLVKTSFCGRGLNLGRVVAALGRSGLNFDPKRICLSVGRWMMVEKGMIKEPSRALDAYLRKDEIELNLNLKSGKKGITMYGCDLGFEYLKINISYN